MKALNIISHHQSLASAVAAVNPDFSYNPEVAKNRIMEIDRNCTRAFVATDGEIYYVFSCDIEILHKFEPFISCLSDGNFSVAFIVGDLLSISEPKIPNTKEGRNWFKKANKISGAIAA